MKHQYPIPFKNHYYGNFFQNNSKLFKYYFYAFFGKVFYFILLIFSLIILNYTTTNKSSDTLIRNSILFISKPMLVVIELPFNLIFDFGVAIKNILLTNQINSKLKKENLLLRESYINSIDIQGENLNLKKILNFVDSLQISYDFITTNVYAESKNSMNRNFILNIGTEHGIKEGSLILGVSKSVVGRVINVADNFANVLLLTDIASKIPARTAATKERIILSGKNNHLLEISYFNSKNPIIDDGEFVFTSGDSDIIPDGLFIGKIKKIREKYYVEMDENVNKIFDIVVITNKNKKEL